MINEMATKRIVGQVLPEERDEIQQLFERRNGLNELARIVTADNTELYENSSWEINFNTCDIYLVGGQCDECNA